jgi:hypothetical protein
MGQGFWPASYLVANLLTDLVCQNCQRLCMKAVGFALLGGGSNGSWRGAFGVAQCWKVKANSEGVFHPS